ncbi:MAG: ATP-binding cassette domain-containing protein [Patescibacteria group bacterium]
MANILELKNYTVATRDKNIVLLHDINCEIHKNEIHCILGKNGSGKSTLAYSIMGMDRFKQKKGKLHFNGQDITGKKTYERARAGITLAFQEPSRFEGLKVSDFFRAGNKKATDTEIKKTLEMVDLGEEFADRNIDENLSGGERKRIEIASVIIMKPKLIIMDEPDTSLDIIVYNELYDLLLRIKKELKCSILLITHREEAGLVADRATLIENGRCQKTGRFREVMQTYCQRMGRKEKCKRICK